MKKSTLITIIIIAVILIWTLVGGVIGYQIGSGVYKKDSSDGEDTLSQTFYAEIKEINGNSLLVEGLSVNDINFRGQFSFSVTDETKLEWRYTEISLSDLDVGDKISVTFTGAIMESYPAGLTEVVRIQLLDDEK